MKFGLHFGSRGVAGDPDSLKAVALKAEVLGYEHFGMSDHVIVATEVESAYPTPRAESSSPRIRASHSNKSPR